MNRTKPVTDRQSRWLCSALSAVTKLRLLRRFLHFILRKIPRELEVRQRVSTYYGAELLLEPIAPNSRSKFLPTAPGPDAYLYLCASETDADGFRGVVRRSRIESRVLGWTASIYYL
jgi:hypothetical protein